MKLSEKLDKSQAHLGWPAQFEPKDVSSLALAPFLMPLLANPRQDRPYLRDLKDRLLDLTVRMARQYTRWYAHSLFDDLSPVSGTTMLNINIPQSASASTEIRITCQSRQSHYLCDFSGTRDLSSPFRLPVVERIDFDSLEPDSDLHAFFVDKVISVTPMALDLTEREAIVGSLAAWFVDGIDAD